jgi:hypothetical protein
MGRHAADQGISQLNDAHPDLLSAVHVGLAFAPLSYPCATS